MIPTCCGCCDKFGNCEKQLEDITVKGMKCFVEGYKREVDYNSQVFNDRKMEKYDGEDLYNWHESKGENRRIR